MKNKVGTIFIAMVFLLASFTKSFSITITADVNLKPSKAASTLYVHNKCSLYVVVYAKHWAPLEDRLYEENIPILWVYKNGVRIKEYTINELDPNKAWTREGEGGLADYIDNALSYGEIAEIRLKVDPLNKIDEGGYRMYHRRTPTGSYDEWKKVADYNYEQDNEKTWIVSCGKGTVELNCPRGAFHPGKEVRVSGKLNRHNYGLFRHNRLKYFTIAGVMKLVSGGQTKIIGAESISLRENENERTFEIKGKIPTDIPIQTIGRYTLLIEFETYNERISFDSVSCPINILPTVQEMGREGKVPAHRFLLPEAEKIACASMPDLKIEAVETTYDCKVRITVRNMGAGLQDTLYNSNPVIFKITDQQGFRPFARFTLSQFDPQRKLKSSGGQVVFTWEIPKSQLPVNKVLEFLVDPDRKIMEGNERNNSMTKRITCGKEVRREKKPQKSKVIFHKFLRK